MTRLRISKFIVRARGIEKTHELEDGVVTRHAGVRGYDQAIMEQAMVVGIGCGGLGGYVYEGLVRKGVGTLVIVDGDVVELSNLNRQLFYAENLYKNKAIELAKNLEKFAVRPTTIIAYPMMYEEVLDRNANLSTHVMYCGVDNNATRVAVTRHCLENGIPLIISGISLDADHGYVFVQEPGKTCFGCFLPSALDDSESPCPNTPATIDILNALTGFSLYAIDSILMKRPRNWNYRHVYLSGEPPDSCCVIEKKLDCKLCSRSAE